MCWGVAIVALPLPCALTSLENWARARAGMNRLPTTGFIDRYVAGVLYPSDRTGAVQALGFGAAALPWIALARKRRPACLAKRTRVTDFRTGTVQESEDS